MTEKAWGPGERASLDAVHELRTPLTRIRGELELILRAGVTDPLRGQLERVQEDLEELSRLCGALLLLARLGGQSEVLSFLEDGIDLEEIVCDLLEQMTPFARDRGVSLRRGATKATQLRGSRQLLVEALLNLLDAAIRGSAQGGVVSVTVDDDRRLARLVVADAGGVRGDARSDLSLAIAREIARLHGGRFELAEAPGGLGLFRLFLPSATAD